MSKKLSLIPFDFSQLRVPAIKEDSIIQGSTRPQTEMEGFHHLDQKFR